MASNIKPYKISVPDAAITKLKEKLASATFFDELDFTDDWKYGAPLSDVERLARHWRDGFDWRAAEARLNELPQFTTTIAVDGFDELQIHFVHQKSAEPDSIPLLFCHGWPGSFLEVIKILPLLTGKSAGDGPTFHVVAPSLPNYGFSQGVRKPGFSIAQYAEVCHKLMLQLGYGRYATQGGDWGFIITRHMGLRYPAHCLANHINMCLARPPRPLRHPLLFLRLLLWPFSPAERAGVERTRWFRKEGYGYNLEQATRPHTIGHALADSPVALLAWVYEKLHDWTDAYPWTDDEALTWISIYQFSTAGPAASVRIYYENEHQKALSEQGVDYNAKVKLGISYFPRDIILLPKVFGRTLGPVVLEQTHDRGGHFAAYETPELLVGDLRKMFGKGGGAQAVSRQLGSKL